jgi:hypothetical protein
MVSEYYLPSSALQVLQNTFGFCLVRFVFAGAFHKKLRNFPCIFGAFLSSIPESKQAKLRENLWYWIWHSFSVAANLKLLSECSWFKDSLSVTAGLVQTNALKAFFTEHTEHEWPLGMQEFYLLEFSFWMSCLIFIGVETIRKDFLQMLGHHVVTLLLVAISYKTNFHRAGLVVMLLHDLGDVFLYSAKVFLYMGFKAITDTIFGLFVLAFFSLRLLYFPLFIIVPLAIHTFDSSSG